jgi:4-amino-4-deoxy-L-arabinose transferase-like glycosyltransferase
MLATRTNVKAEAWLEAHFEWIVWAVVLGGLVLRILRAASLYFNGDEAMIMFAPLQPSLGAVYRAMLVHPHGPLPNFLLHYMAYFGSSELYFRLPSVIAGALLPYVVYRWVADTFDSQAGLVAACILSFSPAVIILSAQLRFYTIQMLFMACSLYCLERAFREKSVAWMRLFGAALLLALWSEYMSVWYTVAIGIYAAIRLLAKEAPRRLKVEWAVTQLAAAALVTVAYFTHLERLKGNAGELLARDGWLRRSYFHPESQSAWGFMHAATGDLFEYLFANPTLGQWMIYVFLIGIGVILWRNRRVAVLALLLPVAVTAGAAMLRVYPYGGSRHDAFLTVFLAPAIAVALSFGARGRPAVVLLMMACLIPAWLKAERPHALDDRPQVSKRDQMNRALSYLSQLTPQARVLVVDQLGSATLSYYLCQGRRDEWRAVAPDANTYRCGDYRLLTVEAWGAPLAAYREALWQARKAWPDLFPDPAWTFSISFTRDRDVSIVAADFGLFGKIELWRIWPPP